jgi:hypothetical protein
MPDPAPLSSLFSCPDEDRMSAMILIGCLSTTFTCCTQTICKVGGDKIDGQDTPGDPSTMSPAFGSGVLNQTKDHTVTSAPKSLDPGNCHCSLSIAAVSVLLLYMSLSACQGRVPTSLPPSMSTHAPPVSTDPLWQVKLLAALRSGDVAQIQPFLSDIKPAKKHGVSEHEPSALDETAGVLLHFAIRGATCKSLFKGLIIGM